MELPVSFDLGQHAKDDAPIQYGQWFLTQLWHESGPDRGISSIFDVLRQWSFRTEAKVQDVQADSDLSSIGWCKA